MADLYDLLTNPNVRAALKQAWSESQPGASRAHEEGGFIVERTSGEMRVVRWPRGSGRTIEVPPHHGCQVAGMDIVASFHTHPNVGADFLQEPSETDRRAVRDDPDLKGAEYAGELVISAALVYGVTPFGRVVELGSTEDMLL